ncbi:MAG: trypsin-like serine protease, partial [Gaiellales bacterium]
ITNRNDVALLRLKRAPAASSGVVPVLPVQEGEDGIWGAGAGIGTSAAAGPWVAGWGERFVPADAMFFSGAQHSPILRPTTPKPRPTRYKNARTSSRSTARAGRSLSNTLMQAAVPIQSDARCELGSMGIAKDIGMGIDFDPASMLCAGKLDTADRNDLNTTTDGVDSCYGDSGGPLLATVGGALRLVGLVSFGTGCATRDSFGVYTRVASMRSFLNRPVRRAVTLKQRPRVAGAKRIGGMLRCHRGSWGGAGPLRFSYRWVTPYDDTLGVSFEFGESWERLPRSGTRATYRIKPDDRGREIACMVIASNSSSTMVRPSLKVQVPGKRPVDPEAEPEGGSEEDMPSGMPLG